MQKAVLISIQPYWVFLIIAKAMGWNIEKEKTDEVRKNYPKAQNWDKTVKIYCSKDKKSFAKIPKEYQPLMQPFLGKVIGEFVCNCIEEYESEFVDDDCFEWIASIDRDEHGGITGFYEWTNELDIPYINTNFFRKCCVGYEDLKKYIGIGIDTFYGWHISNLIIYDKPKELSEFQKYGALNYDDWLYGMYNGSSESSYEKYLIPFKMSRPPQSWCYVERFGRFDE